MKILLKVLAVLAAVVLTGCLIIVAVCAHNGLGISDGRFYRAENGSVLLLDDHGATVLSAKWDGMFDKLKDGDKILVVHDGIEESYPARTGAYYCICTETGDTADLPENIMLTLQELGWVATEPEPVPDIAEEIPFSAQYIRTNGNSEKIPNITVVTAVEQLQNYYETNKEYFNLERNENVSSDFTIGFLDACDRYDDAFFKDSQLIIVTLEAGSGSIRHEVVKIEHNAVHIQSIVPEVGTCDMAQWHFLIEIPASHFIEPADDIDIFLDGTMITEKFTVAECSGTYGNISLKIPEGWECEISNSTAEGMSCGISFWPAGENSGKVSVTFIPNGWGVCGTGLREEKSVIGNYPVSVGYYGKTVWDYIVFNDLPGTYVVQRWEDIPWWSQHQEKVMQILSTVRLAEGFITESAAVSTAIAKLGGGEYKACEDIWVECDMKNGLWRIEFYRNSKDHATVAVIVDFWGNILEVSE